MKKRKAAKVFTLATFSTVRKEPALCGALSVFCFSFRSQYVLSTSCTKDFSINGNLRIFFNRLIVGNLPFTIHFPFRFLPGNLIYKVFFLITSAMNAPAAITAINPITRRYNNVSLFISFPPASVKLMLQLLIKNAFSRIGTAYFLFCLMPITGSPLCRVSVESSLPSVARSPISGSR